MSVSTGTNSARCSAQTPWPVDHDDGWRAEPNNYGEGVPAGWRAPIIPSTSSPRYHANRQFTQPPEGNQFIKNAQWAAPIAPPESPELSSERLGAMVLFERYDTDKDGKVDLNQCSLMIRDMLPGTHEDLSTDWIKAQARRMLIQVDLDHDGKIDLEEFLLYARANADVFGRLPAVAMQQRGTGAQREQLTMSVERAAHSGHSSPRRVHAQIETLRATADPCAPYRTGTQPTTTERPPHLLPPRTPFELSELDSEWFALFSKYDLHGDDRLDVHEVCLLITDLVPQKCEGPSASWIKAQADDLFMTMDADRDGLIHFDEFVAFAKNSHEMGDLLARYGSGGRIANPHRWHIKRNDDKVETQAKGTAHAQITSEWEQVLARFKCSLACNQNKSLGLRDIEMLLHEGMPHSSEALTGAIAVPNMKWIKLKARQLLLEMDLDGDGQVDAAEFHAYMCKHEICSTTMLGSSGPQI